MASAGPLPALGGPGGATFESRCPGNTVLVGLALRVGEVVDAVHSICAPLSGAAGAEGTMPWQGGPGGNASQVACPAERPTVTGLFVNSAGQRTRVVDNLLLYCGRGNDARRSSYARPDAAANLAATQNDTQACAPGEVAVGVHGRAGVWVDALGLICARPEAAPTPTTVRSIGRLKPRGAALATTTTTTTERPSHVVLVEAARGMPALKPARSVQATLTGTVQISVLYPQSLGYAGERDGAPYSCEMFLVAVRPAGDARQTRRFPSAAPAGMSLRDGQYRCDYQIQDLPLNTSLTVGARIADPRTDGTAPWLGGGESQPPAGESRTLLDPNREIVLTHANPTATVAFQMTYAGSP